VLLAANLSLHHLHQSRPPCYNTNRSQGVASPKGPDDALAALMSEAGMEEQAARLRRLKVSRSNVLWASKVADSY